MPGEGFRLGIEVGAGLGDALKRGVNEWKSIQLDKKNRQRFEGRVQLYGQRVALFQQSAGADEAAQLEELRKQVQRSPGAQQEDRVTGVKADGSPDTEPVLRTAEGDIPIQMLNTLKIRQIQAQSQVEVATVNELMGMIAQDPDNPYVKQFVTSAYAGIQQKRQLRIDQIQAENAKLEIEKTQLERDKFAQAQRQYDEQPGREQDKETFETDQRVRGDLAIAEGKAKIERQNPKGPGESDIAGMRKEYGSASQDFVKVRDAYSRIQSIANDPSPAGDVALIFSFIRILDPGSTVREGEFATAEQTRGVPETVVQQYNKALKGERLAPGQRQDFIRQSTNLYSAQERNQKKLEGQFRSLAERRGMNPDDVVLDIGAAETPAAAPPAAGGVPPEVQSVLDKYRAK